MMGIADSRRERMAKAPTVKKRAAAAKPARGNDDSVGNPVELYGWKARVVGRSLERATKRSLDRGRAFLDAALTLLRESGGDGFTVQQVADLAGVSLRTFYQHFATKNELLLAVFEEEVQRHADELRRAVEKYSDPLERLAMFVVGGASSTGHPNESIALTRYRLALQESHPDELAVVQVPVVALARELIINAMEAGVIPAGDPEGLAYMIVTLKSSLLHSRILGNELGVRLPTPVESAQFCLEGLGGKLPASFAKPDERRSS